MINQILTIALPIIITFFAAYLIGSIPTGYIVVKLLKGEDIRQIGSGSTGATNVKRVLGKGWFFGVMLIDAFKGALPVLVAKYFDNEFGILAVIAAIAVLVGHSKSIFLGFTGGKSVASGVGTILALCWQVGLIIAIVWSIITYVSKYVSMGSIFALVISPTLMYIFNQPYAYVVYCALGAMYIVYLHRENIKRLFDGTENKVR